MSRDEEVSESSADELEEVVDTGNAEESAEDGNEVPKPEEVQSGDDEVSPREAMIAKLTGKSEDPEPKPDEESESDEDEDDDDELGDAGDDTDDDQDDSLDDLDDLDEPEPEEDKDADLPDGVKKRTKRAFDRLRKKNAELETSAQYGTDVLKYCEEAGLDSQELSGLLRIGRMIKKDPANAQKMLVDVAKSLGPLEAEPAAGEIPANMQALIDKGHMDEDAARELIKTQPPAPRPAALAQPEPAVPTFSQAAPAQPTPQADTAEDTEGKAKLGKLLEAAESKYKADWEKLYPVVKKRMASVASESRPKAWPRLFKLTLKAAIADLKPRKERRSPESLSPSTSSPSARKTDSPRQSTIARLVGGKI